MSIPAASVVVCLSLSHNKNVEVSYIFLTEKNDQCRLNRGKHCGREGAPPARINSRDVRRDAGCERARGRRRRRRLRGGDELDGSREQKRHRAKSGLVNSPSLILGLDHYMHHREGLMRVHETYCWMRT